MRTPSGIGGKSCQDRGSPCWPPKCSNSHKLLIQLPIRLIKIAHSMGKNGSLFYICRVYLLCCQLNYFEYQCKLRGLGIKCRISGNLKLHYNANGFMFNSHFDYQPIASCHLYIPCLLDIYMNKLLF